MIDASHVKVRPHATGAVGGNLRHEPHKRGLNSKLHISVDAHGWPLGCTVTKGTWLDCKEAPKLIQDIVAESLLAGGAYDSNEIIQLAEKRGMQVAIPPRKNRKFKCAYDKHLYKLRQLVGNEILHLKRWRGIATRYAKNSASFLAGVQIRCIAMWASIL